MLRKFIAGLLSLVFVLVSGALVFVFALGRTVLNGDFYRGEFIDLVHEIIITELPKNISLSEVPVFSEDDFRSVLEKTLTRKDLILIVDYISEQLANRKILETDKLDLFPDGFLRGKTEVLSLEFTDLLYKKLKPCESDDIADGPILNSDLQCLPDNVSREDVEAEFAAMLDREIFAGIEDELALDLPDGFDGDIAGVVKDAVNKMLLTGTAILFFVLFLIGLVIFKPIKRVLLWESKTIFFAVLGIVLTFFPLLFSSDGFKYFSEAFGLFDDPETMDLVARIFNFTFDEISRDILLWTVPILIVSGGLWFWLKYYYKTDSDGIVTVE